MKRIIALMTAVVVVAVSSAFSSPNAAAEETQHDNVLIAYFPPKKNIPFKDVNKRVTTLIHL